ncbi:MAG: outer membrane lipoprotein-sorting protein [Spirochaetes bacterium]|nr:outer membrane lipoprotein-sorting protein [Spirochaetota bacterium]
MKSRFIYAVLAGIVSVILIGDNAYALNGREIMEKNDALKKPGTSMQTSVLLIVKGNKKEKKEFSGIMKKYGKNTRSRISFSYPTRLEFLVWDEPGNDSLQWIKLSSGRVRKIASSDKGKPWVNSHFYNEDIGDTDIDDYSYKLIGEGKADNIPCYKIESVKIHGTKVYSKSIVYISKNDYTRRKVEFFEKGSHTKTITFEKIEKIDGIYTPRKLVMERTDGKGKSILYVASIKYDVPVSDAKLKRESF